jgi:hypothetical protein
MIQPQLLTHLIQNSGHESKGKRKFLTPGTPRFKIQTINTDVLDADYQIKYRSGVGILLYLTKYSCPDICNTVRELLKCMDSATWKTYTELFRVIKFAIDTKTFGLKMQPKLDNNLGWSLKIFFESNWAGDPETRLIVTVFITYLLDVPICLQPKSKKGVTLSSTKVKYVSISEDVKEVKLVDYLLSDVHIKVNLAIMVRTDNIGAIIMSENT